MSSVGLPEDEESSEVQDIIESTPELDMDLSGYKTSRYSQECPIDNEEKLFNVPYSVPFCLDGC